MSVFFKVPSIGNKSEKQKGPTCWFYAAKMIRKFHDAYDKMDGGSNIRLLSLIRKVITFMDEDLKSSDYGPEAPKSFQGMSAMAKLPITPPSDPFGLVLYKGFLRFAQQSTPSPATTPASPPVVIDLTHDTTDPLATGTATSVPSGPPTPNEYETAFNLMLSWGRDSGFSRQAILDKWDFRPLKNLAIMDALQSTKDFEKLLTERGPIWAGGFFEPQTLLPLEPGTKKPFVHGDKGGWARQFQLKTDFANTHAIAILGVSEKEQLILYRDPNFSATVCTLPFAQFSTGMLHSLKQDAISLMYYDCSRCRIGASDCCVKREVKKQKVTLSTVPSNA